eukprot:2087836-Pyramimonas_sp.AAC.1
MRRGGPSQKARGPCGLLGSPHAFPEDAENFSRGERASEEPRRLLRRPDPSRFHPIPRRRSRMLP